MSSKLGTLTLDLVARIGQFIAPIEQARDATTDATDEIEEGFTTAGLAAKAFGAILAGVSIGAVAEYVNGLMQAGNELVAFSRLANASVEQFQYYAKGAAYAGIEMEQFADQMKDVQDRIGDFQQSGGGPLADFFENIAPLIGVTIQQFQKLSGPEALQLFYDSLQKVGATENDIKFYMEGLIGDSSKLIPLLENGGEGFKKWGDNAVAAGSIVSESTARTLADAGTNVQMLMEHWTGFKVEMAENVAPVITGTIDHLDTIKAVAIALGAAIATKLVVQLGILSIEFVKGIIEGVRYQMALAAMAGQTITLTSATVALRTAMWSLIGGPAGLGILAVQVLAAGAAFLYMKKSSDDVKPSLDSQSLSIKELIADFENLGEAAQRSQLRFENNKLSDLSDSYDDAKSKLVSLVISMGRFDDSSDTAIKTANALAMQYKQGDLTAEQLASKINALTGASSKAKGQIDEQAAAVAKVKTEMDKQQQVTEALTNKNGQLANAHDRVSASVNAQAKAYLSLTQKQREALNGINSDIEKSQYIQANMAAGWSRDKAEFYADYRSNAGLGFMGKALSPFEIETVDQGFKLQQSTKAREESEKNIENSNKKQADALKKQNEEAAKKYNYSKAELEMMKRVSTLAAQYNFSDIESKHGLPKNTLAALMAQESGGNRDAVSPTGAIGYFQTTSDYRKDNKLSIADSKDLSVVPDVIAKNLAKAYKELGSIEAAIRSHNAGVAGSKLFGETGRVKGSDARNKEVANFAPSVNRWQVGLNGSDDKNSGFLKLNTVDTLADYQTFLDKTEQLRVEALARQLAIVQTYADEEQQIHDDNAEAIKSIQEAFTVDDANRQKYLDLQKMVYQKDLLEFERNQEAKRIAAYKSLNDPIYSMQSKGLEATAKVSMNPMQYQAWQLNNEQQGGYSALSDDLGLARTGINDSELLTAQEKYSQLENAYDVYLQNKAALDAQYDEQHRELAESQHQMQMDIWQDLLSRTATIFGQMAEMVKNTSGESSAAYKAMFLVNQGISMAQAMINTEVAATKAMAEGGMVAGIPMATAIRALGYASVGMIAAQTISGMAHDGIDNIPKEGTWLLDKGERVVDSRTNSDLKNYLANGGGSGGDVHISVQVTDSGVTSQSNQAEQKQLGQMIGNAVRSVIMQEKRQGGLLSK